MGCGAHWLQPTKTTFVGLGKNLPANVKLMTFGVVSPQYNDQVWPRQRRDGPLPPPFP